MHVAELQTLACCRPRYHAGRPAPLERACGSVAHCIHTMQAPVFSRQPRLPSPFGQFVYTFPLFRRVPGAPCRPLQAQHPAGKHCAAAS